MADESLDDAWADALEEANGTDADTPDEDWDSLTSQTKNVKAGSNPASFDELSGSAAGHGATNNLDFLLDIPLKVSVELGRTSMIIDKMLQLTQGSVVELEKAAGEAVEIYVNRKLLGKGEVIVINDRFGVRITEIISQADRIKNMA